MLDFGVNLICVEDGIDSSKNAGKLMISVLSAVAEIERTGINQADISKLENGTRNPSVNLLKRLADGMGMALKIEFVPKQKA